MNELNALDCPLDGMNLIEAGAGTGKTYTIQTLVARIVLEQAVPIEKILVVTFTRAATAELRDRVRKVLLCLQQALNEQLDPADPEVARCQAILANLSKLPADAPFWGGEGPDATKVPSCAKRLLADALRDFDQAAISTIHSFCQRMLNENAFESGIRYGMELRSDISELCDGLTQQFVRQEFYRSGHEVLAIWDALDISWEEAKRDEDERKNNFGNSSKKFFVKEIKKALNQHGVRYHWGEESEQTAEPTREQCLQGIRKIMQELRTPEQRENLKNFLGKIDKDVKKDPKDPKDALQKILTACQDGQSVPTLADLERASEETIVAHRYIKYEEPVFRAKFLNDANHLALLALLASLASQLRAYRSCCYRDALSYVNDALAEQKSRESFLIYDDLLNELKERLSDPVSGSALRALIHQLFPYALVDEFQDTDPVQFEIFHSIFGDGTLKNSGFFMIGDPKQAIYSFRGGDLHSYLQARERVAPERRYTLTTNYRSSKPFIDALNDFYRYNQPWPFAHHELPIEKIQSPPNNVAELRFEGKARARPLLVNPHSANVPETTNACVQQIKTMLHDTRWTLFDGKSERGLEASDFAVLFRTNHNAKSFEGQLRREKIAAVRIGVSNVMDSDAAKQLKILLDALADPADSRLVVKLLASSFYGIGAKRLYELRNSQDPEDSLMRHQRHLATLASCWEERSFARMIQDFFGKGQGEDSPLLNLAKHQDGERMLADVLHIVELLSSAEAKERLDSAALRNYFERQCRQATEHSGEDSEDNEQLIRLATERRAVILSSIHVSKGLQYPIVMLPDLYSSSKSDNLISHQERDGKLCALYDVTGIGTYKEDADHEAMQEKLRVFYVAITRAKFFCAIFMQGNANRGSQNVMKYLFRDREKDELRVQTGGVKEEEKKEKKEKKKKGAEQAQAESNEQNEAPEAPPVESAEQKAAPEQAPMGGSKAQSSLAKLSAAIIVNNWSFPESSSDKLCVAPPPPPEEEDSEANEEDSAAGEDESAAAATKPTAAGAVDASPPQDSTPPPPLVARRLAPQTVNPFWYSTSATKLEGSLLVQARGTSAAPLAAPPSADAETAETDAPDEELRDLDAQDNVGTRKLTRAEWQELPRIFQLSRGKKAGICWHSLFEDLDFTANDEAISRLVEEKLQAYSLLQEPGDVAVVAQMVRNVLDTPLQLPNGPPSFALNSIGQEQRLSELEFDYCLRDRRQQLKLTRAQLARYALPGGEDFSVGLARALTGCIDLLLVHGGRYYIVDWKSNVIDYDLANFSGDGLRAEMRKHAYGMQYLVYCVVLAEFIDDRQGHFNREDYDALFGGVFYIFLRGVDAQKPLQGIWADKPDYDDIEALRGMIGRK
jgi:exodeoxyribonuclease V beta subunit